MKHRPSLGRTTATLLATAFVVGGCQHTIRLDPGSEDATVYVNGDLRGSGVSKFDVEDEYGFPESFTAKVYPASSSPYTVEIAREFDWGRGVYRLGTSVVSGAAFLGVQYLQVRDAIARDNWPTLMFPLWSVGFFGAIIVATAPLDLLRSFRYRSFYDLELMRDARDARPAKGEQATPMKTSE